MVGLTDRKRVPQYVKRVITTIVDNVAETLRLQKKVTLKEIQDLHSKSITQEHIEKWATGLEQGGIAALEGGAMDSQKLVAKHVPGAYQVVGKRKRIVEVLDSYELKLKTIPAYVEIVRMRGEFVANYILHRPEIAPATKAILENVKVVLIRSPDLKTEEMTDPKMFHKIDEKFTEGAKVEIEKAFPGIAKRDRDFLADMVVINMLGLGDIDIIMTDDYVEDVVVNSGYEPIQLYHRIYGWLRTNLTIGDEKKVREISESIARRVGRQVTNLNPLLDAHLVSGDRVNATLIVISPKGNTVTIRRFARKPWTVVDMVKKGTITNEIASFIWLAMQHEMNFLVIGGTGSGKTSVLNAILPFVQPNHRIISIEDTRELNLPEFMHWVSLVSRNPNPEGKGAITMLDLMINTLRMRPDRLIVGEVRAAEHAKVMFEAIHTGHSCYGTFHADSAASAFRRLTEAPISLPPVELQGLHLLVTAFRDRKLNRRRIAQIVELAPSMTEEGVDLNLVYRWEPRGDKFEKINQSVRVFNDVEGNTGLSREELEKDIRDKMMVIDWLVYNNVTDINTLGAVIANYYLDQDRVLKLVKRNAAVAQIVRGW